MSICMPSLREMASDSSSRPDCVEDDLFEGLVYLEILHPAGNSEVRDEAVCGDRVVGGQGDKCQQGHNAQGYRPSPCYGRPR